MALGGNVTGAALAEYPEKPVTFIVPWPPGDLEDVLTRMIAEEFQKQTGAPAAVVNKPGGGGVVGGAGSGQAPADGYTIGSFVVGIPTVKTMGADAQIAARRAGAGGHFPDLSVPDRHQGRCALFDTWQELAEYSKANDGAPRPLRLWARTDDDDRSSACRNWAANSAPKPLLTRWIAPPSPMAMPM